MIQHPETSHRRADRGNRDAVDSRVDSCILHVGLLLQPEPENYTYTPTVAETLATAYRSAENLSQKASEAGSGMIASEAWLGARRLATAQVGAGEQAGRSGSGEAAGVVGDKEQVYFLAFSLRSCVLW